MIFCLFPFARHGNIGDAHRLDDVKAEDIIFCFYSDINIF